MELSDTDEKYWQPIKETRDVLDTKFTGFPVLEVGPGTVPLGCATHFIDCVEEKKINTVNIDIDTDRFPFDDHQFKLIYSRHVLEDIQNPDAAFREMTRVAEYGFIETPSPFAECSRNVECKLYKGYAHHRYIVWTETETNTLCFLPKYPLIDLIEFDGFPRVLDNPWYWNNYYEWSPESPPRVRMYKNGVNFNIFRDYAILLSQALKSCVDISILEPTRSVGPQDSS